MQDPVDKFIDSTTIVDTVCPTCDKKMEAVTDPSLRGLKPSPGDMTVCSGCNELLQFDDDMKLKYPSDEVVNDIDLQELASICGLINVVNRLKKEP